MKYLKSLKYLAGRNGVRTGDKGAPQKAQPLGTGWCSAAFSISSMRRERDDIARVLFFRRSGADVRSDGECVIAAERHESSSLHWQLYYIRDTKQAGCQVLGNSFGSHGVRGAFQFSETNVMSPWI